MYIGSSQALAKRRLQWGPATQEHLDRQRKSTQPLSQDHNPIISLDDDLQPLPAIAPDQYYDLFNKYEELASRLSRLEREVRGAESNITPYIDNSSHVGNQNSTKFVDNKAVVVAELIYSSSDAYLYPFGDKVVAYQIQEKTVTCQIVSQDDVASDITGEVIISPDGRCKVKLGDLSQIPVPAVITVTL